MDSIDFAAGAPNGSILRFVIEKKRVGISSATYAVVVYSNVPDDVQSVPHGEHEYKIFETTVTFVAVDADGKKINLQ